MLNKRIATGFMSIAGALAIAGGATFAYFTDSAVSGANTFSTGSIGIDISQQGVVSGDVNVTANWMPGESKSVVMKVVNDSTIPINLRGLATGTWHVEALDNQNMVKVTQIEYNTGSGFVPLVSKDDGIQGVVYLGDNGNETNLLNLPAGKDVDLRITVKLDENAGSDFMNKTFTAEVEVEAKQANVGHGGWPTP